MSEIINIVRCPICGTPNLVDINDAPGTFTFAGFTDEDNAIYEEYIEHLKPTVETCIHCNKDFVVYVCLNSNITTREIKVSKGK